MRISIGSDHAGFNLKENIKALLTEMGHEIDDVGTYYAQEKADYPDVGFNVAMKTASGKAERGVLICGTGIGMSITANKVKGVYAALCNDELSARLAREHNNANVLVLGGRTTGPDIARAIVKAWLGAHPRGDRHLTRRQKITEYESRIPGEDQENVNGRLKIIDHPLIQHKLAIVRDKNTSVKDFRDLVQEIAGLMVYEISRNLPLEKVDIHTPIRTTTGFSLSGKKLAVVPVLRAGLGMVEGIVRLIPNAKVGHIGAYRDPDTLNPVDYYCKLPTDISERDIFVLDPMLATGGTASYAIAEIKRKGGRRISLVSLIAAPEGVKKISSEHPEVDIFTAALDACLNEHGYIVPGLGDAGDRLFGTQ